MQVLIASKARNKGYFEYLYELRLARERFGYSAADYQLALDLEFATRKPKKKK